MNFDNKAGFYFFNLYKLSALATDNLITTRLLFITYQIITVIQENEVVAHK